MIKLSDDLKKQIKSSYEISNIYDCLVQLIYNSIDAHATSIQVKVNFFTNDVIVIDDGVGINECDMNLIGEW